MEKIINNLREERQRKNSSNPLKEEEKKIVNEIDIYYA